MTISNTTKIAISGHRICGRCWLEYNYPHFTQMTIEGADANMSAPMSLCRNLQILLFRRPIANWDRIVSTRSIHLKDKSLQNEKTELYTETDEDELEKIRNVSGLRPGLRKRLAHVDEMPDTWTEYMRTRRFQRRMYARFGSASGLDPGIMWPSKLEMKEMAEDDEEFEPTLEVMVQRLQSKKEAQEKRNYEK